MSTTLGLKRPRTASRATRRRQLIEATYDCIAENGLTGTTLGEVGRRADLSMGLVSFHFRSKENLLQETLVHLAEEHRKRWTEGLAGARDPAAKLAAVMDAHFHPSTCNHTHIAVWFAFFGEARHRDVYREKIARFDAERTGTVTRLCAALAEREGVALDAGHVAGNLESLADGLWLSIMLYPAWLDRRTAKAQIHSFLRLVFPSAFATWPGETDDPDPRSQPSAGAGA